MNYRIKTTEKLPGFLTDVLLDGIENIYISMNEFMGLFDVVRSEWEKKSLEVDQVTDYDLDP